MTVRKRTDHTTVYVIEWPRHGIVKVGITQVERWQAFIGKGGRVVALLRFLHGHDHGPLTPAEWEQALLARCTQDGNYVEWKRGLSESLLGNSSAGHTECRQMGGHDALLQVEALLELHQPTWCRIEIGHAYAGCICGTHRPGAEAEQNRREHALTEKAFQDPGDNTSSVTHTRACRPRRDSQPFAHAPIRASSIQSPDRAEPHHVIHRLDEHADATPTDWRERA
jgi:hypothetical protein